MNTSEKKLRTQICFYSNRIDCLKKKITSLENQLRQYEAWREETEKELEALVEVNK